MLGIEAVPDAVEDAGENARSERHRQRDASSRATWPRCCARSPKGIASSPRASNRPTSSWSTHREPGLSKKAVSRIGEVGAPRIIYVSCNPSTLAPNVAQMQEYGYRFEHVTPVDMFPHTPHVECVGVLTLQR